MKRTDRQATPAILQRTWPPVEAGSIHTVDGRSQTPSAIYRELRMVGLGPDEAGNLTAYLNGLHPVGSGWTPREIERLRFMRHLVERERAGRAAQGYAQPEAGFSADDSVEATADRAE